MKTVKRFGVAAVAMLAVLLTGTACTMDEPTAKQKENDSRMKTYSSLIERQPAHSMKYSPTRETKNFWIDTWGEKGKLSYVYLMDGTSKVFGYFVLEGLPVSYCTGLIPPTQWEDIPGDGGSTKIQVPAPSVDGTYSSASNCNTYYGKDATSGTYIEYTAGMGINALVFSEPRPQYGAAEPMGDATISQVGKS